MNQYLKDRIEAGLEDMAPDILEQILAQEIKPIESEEELFGQLETDKYGESWPPQKKERSRWRKWKACISGIAAMFVLIIGLAAAQEYQMIEGEITVDVNPSISLNINHKGLVRNVEALNEDGEAIVKEMDVTRGDVDAVLDNVFEMLESNRYLQNEKSGVLVSYCYTKESKKVESKIKSAIVGLCVREPNCTVYSQKIQKEKEAVEHARAEGVSLGKYYFVNSVREKSAQVEQLAYKKTMEEIVTYIDDNSIPVSEMGVRMYTNNVQVKDIADTVLADTGKTGAETDKKGKKDAIVSEADPVNKESGNGESAVPADTGTTNVAVTDNTSIQEPEPPVVPPVENNTPVMENAVGELPEPSTPEPGPSSAEPDSSGTSQEPAADPGIVEPVTPSSKDDAKKAEIQETVAQLAISFVDAELLEDGSVIVTWDAQPKATGYDVYCRTASIDEYRLLEEGISENVYIRTNLAAGKSYYFKIIPYIIIDGEKYSGTGVSSSKVDIPVRED